MAAATTRIAASLHSPGAHRPAMANSHDERLLASHARQYGATDHRAVAFDANPDADHASDSSSSSSSSTVDDAGLADGKSSLTLLVSRRILTNPSLRSHLSVHAVPLLAHSSLDRPILLLPCSFGQVRMASRSHV